MVASSCATSSVNRRLVSVSVPGKSRVRVRIEASDSHMSTKVKGFWIIVLARELAGKLHQASGQNCGCRRERQWQSQFRIPRRCFSRPRGQDVNPKHRHQGGSKHQASNFRGNQQRRPSDKRWAYAQNKPACYIAPSLRFRVDCKPPMNAAQEREYDGPIGD